MIFQRIIHTIHHGRLLVKIVSMNVLLSLFLLMMSSCTSGRGDWAYELPNEYQVFMCNSHQIMIIGNENHVVEGVTTNTYVENYILEFCYDNQYVGAKRIVPADILHATTEEIYNNAPMYYILDTLTGDVYGPFDEDSYLSSCKNLNTQMCDWISTASIG